MYPDCRLVCALCDAEEKMLFQTSSVHQVWSHASRRFLPDIATYTILVHYMASQGDLVSAHGLLGQMERSGLTPDARFIAALIRLYFIIGQPSAAIGVVSAVCADVKGFRQGLESIHLAFEPQEGIALTSCLTQTHCRDFQCAGAGLLHLCGIDGLQACLRLMQMCQVNPDRHTQALLESHLIHAEGFTMADVARVSKELSFNDLSLSRLSHLLASSSSLSLS
jgi:pentatricopeptide repeat protein